MKAPSLTHNPVTFLTLHDTQTIARSHISAQPWSNLLPQVPADEIQQWSMAVPLLHMWSVASCRILRMYLEVQSRATSLVGILTFCLGTEKTKMLCGKEVIGPREKKKSQLRKGWRSKLQFWNKRKAAWQRMCFTDNYSVCAEWRMH